MGRGGKKSGERGGEGVGKEAEKGGEGVGKEAEKEVGKEGGGEGSLKSISWRYTDNKVCTEKYIWFSLPSSLEWSLRAK